MLKTILNRPVTVAMFFIAVTIFGFISFDKLPVNLLPNIKYPSVTIWTEYLGNSPEEIEKEITSSIEASIGAVKGIKEIKSSSKDGISLIVVNFEWGTDMDFAVLSLREKLDAATLPETSERSNIIRIDPSEKPILGLSIIGANLFSVRNTTEQIIKRRLEQIDGVALADVIGGVEKEIRIEIDLLKTNKLGISFSEISSAIRGANIEQTGGTIKDDVYLYDLRISSQFESLKDIENTLIKQQENGAIITVKDIAEVKLLDKEKRAFTRFNGRESVGILIRKDADANAVTVSKKVDEVLDQIKKDNKKLIITKAFNQADFIEESISNVYQAVLIGGILAFLTLFLFLKEFKAPANIALSIPISILATFSLIYFSGISINLMSLSGLALGVGMLVDNSIVILENITRHREMGKDIVESALDGTKEVAMPVSASTLTTIIVFMPIVFVSGVAGELFKDQSIAVTFSLLSSLIVSLTLLPVIISRLNLDFLNNKKDKLDTNGSLDNSINSVKGSLYNIGTYWFFVIVFSYFVFRLEDIPDFIAHIFSFILPFEGPEDVTFFDDIPTMIYIVFLAVFFDLIFKFFENMLRVRRLKKLDRENYLSQGKNIRYFLVNKISLIVILLFTLPTIYATRVDIFEPLHRIFALIEINFIDENITPFLYDISNLIKEFFQSYEEELGTNKFVAISYSVGVVAFLVNLFGLFNFSFLRKIPKKCIKSNSQMLLMRESVFSNLKVIAKFIFGLMRFWIRDILIKGIKIIFKPVLISFDFLFESFRSLYHKSLVLALDNRGTTVILSIGLLFITFLLTTVIEKRVMPDIDSGEFVLEVELTPGSSIERTESIIKKYEDIILADTASVKSVFTSGGIPDEKSKISGSTIYKGQLQILLNKGVNTKEFINVKREEINKLNENEPDQIKINFVTDVSTLSDFLQSDNADIAVKIIGSDLDELEQLSKTVISKLSMNSNLTEIKSNFVSKKPKIEINLNLKMLKEKNISPGDIEDFVTTLVRGTKASEFNDFDQKIDIIIGQNEDDRNNLRKLFSTFFRKNGVNIPLKELISFNYKEGPESIERESQQRVITVSANISSGDFDKVISVVEKEVAKIELYKGNKIVVGGQNLEMKSSFEQLIFMFLLSLVLVYMVLASQFESLLSPFIIIFSVPMSLFGVAIGLFIFGESLNIMSIIGVIILIGIVVNDAIVKVDFIDKAVLSGMKVRDAIIEAGDKRLRPILMTTVTTVFGMIPMAIGIGGSSELRRPLAITVIFGLGFATLLTLIVIPVIYSLLKKEGKSDESRISNQES